MWADIIIVSSIVIIVTLIIYFYFFNRRKYGACANCSEARKCKQKGSQIVDDYHKTYDCKQKKEGN